MDDPRITALNAHLGDVDAQADSQANDHRDSHTTPESQDTVHEAGDASARPAPTSPSDRAAPRRLHAVETGPATPRAPDARPRPDLRPLADQLMAIAAQLRGGDVAPNSGTAQNSHTAPTGVAAPPGDAATAGNPGPHQRHRNAVLARNLYAARRRRGAIFDNPELFGEPAWDILLDLYIAHVEGKDVSVSSACIGSAAPPTTGLRWLGVLADENLVCREHDPADQRRILVRLTAQGLEAMDRYFAAAAGRA